MRCHRCSVQLVRFEFQWRQEADDDLVWSASIPIAAHGASACADGLVRSELGGLLPGTTYCVRVRAVHAISAGALPSLCHSARWSVRCSLCL